MNIIKQQKKNRDSGFEIVLCSLGNGTDENGIERYQLIPVWQVNTVVEGTGWAQKEFYNAMTGKYIGFN